MAVPDPVDARLLALVAEVGRVAVHDLAYRAGMDVREVAARLAGLAATGLPLVVGVECDPTALRHVLTEPVVGYPPQVGPYGVFHAGQPSAPAPADPGHPGPGQGRPGQHGPLGGFGPGHSGPSSEFGPGHGGQQGNFGPGHGGPHGGPQGDPVAHAAGLDRVGTWGPPQRAAWARGDEPLTSTERTTPRWPVAMERKRSGTIGDTLYTDARQDTSDTSDTSDPTYSDQPDSLDAPRLAIRLVEVVDPADFLFTAAGYRLQPGERSVMVHAEVTNNGDTPYATLPDLHLVLVDGNGNATSKAPVSLASRRPHRSGIKPGEAAGGHTVYVLPEPTELAAVRWSAGPDDERNALTWSLQAIT